jgi:hypothetical protein
MVLPASSRWSPSDYAEELTQIVDDLKGPFSVLFDYGHSCLLCENI